MRAARLAIAGSAALMALLACPNALASEASEAPSTRLQAAGHSASIADHVAEASQRFGIPERWIRAVMRVESSGDRGAVSPAGAMGLMQIMPGTWAILSVRYRLGNDPFDPRANILGGTAYLREMHDRYGSPGFLAAYNAGPGRYEDYLARRRPLPAETLAYLDSLAPVVGESVAAHPAVAAVPDRNAWTRAALFPARPELPPSDETPTLETTQVAPLMQREQRAAEPRETIFVALSGEPQP